MTPTETPVEPGVYEDAVGALWTVHFDDGREARLLIEPLATGQSVPVTAASIAARGPYTAHVPLTDDDRRRLAIAARSYAADLARGRDSDGADTYRRLAARIAPHSGSQHLQEGGGR